MPICNRSRFSDLGAGSLKHRLVEGLIGIFFGGPDEYAENIAPLIISPDIEQFSGAVFNKRGQSIQPSPVMTDRAYVLKFMEASEQLSKRAFARIDGYPLPRPSD
jgi:hypothetical protein